jgi:tRNA threonylcarbamoyladenosine biosynthesis protein TsaE
MLVNSSIMEFTSHSADQTRSLGMQLGGALQAGDAICLQGDLGAGKTTLVQGIARGWGSVDAVTSPTFILVNVYRRADGNQLFHMDAYRLDSTSEAEELDLDSMLTQGALIIEWPERMQAILPAERLWVQLEHLGAQERGIKFHARGKRSESLLELLRGGV